MGNVLIEYTTKYISVKQRRKKMYKLRFYKLTGADKGAFEHETEYKSIRAMLTAYHEAYRTSG